ncbi:hypothetical protein ETU08_00245 [Apibacter muscae]|uniref:hypothetical protein n=1 Tax=Apibacter muscae TaxID=2509004 RepID=UPI0011ACCCB6|nr:hypothetical protein [Apibacter muscae]TWP23099.1 hypothetical protein ETU10_08365 [Apibacter muscae]TWP31923.1 hypothetical protein ETU08_00245 [Apibacter muscae]
MQEIISFIGLVALIMFAFIVCICITRWVFGISSIIKQSENQTKLLEKIAEKQGVTKEEINEIIGCKK